MASRIQILLVDDDIALLKLLAMRLRAAGYSVETAESGEQALARLAAVQPQLVVTDLRMKSPDGIAVLTEARQLLDAIEGELAAFRASGTVHDELLRAAHTLAAHSATIASTGDGVATVTRPAPARNAPIPASAAAPDFP